MANCTFCEKNSNFIQIHPKRKLRISEQDTPLYFPFSLFTPYQILFEVKSYNSNFFKHVPKIVFLRIIFNFLASESLVKAMRVSYNLIKTIDWKIIQIQIVY